MRTSQKQKEKNIRQANKLIKELWLLGYSLSEMKDVLEEADSTVDRIIKDRNIGCYPNNYIMLLEA